MPLLPEGSTYTGFDQSGPYVEMAGRSCRIYSKQADLCRGSVFAAPIPAQSFDVAIIHTVLMHVPHPENVLQEMIRVTRPGGLVIACEQNRNAIQPQYTLRKPIPWKQPG